MLSKNSTRSSTSSSSSEEDKKRKTKKRKERKNSSSDDSDHDHGTNRKRQQISGEREGLKHDEYVFLKRNDKYGHRGFVVDSGRQGYDRSRSWSRNRERRELRKRSRSVERNKSRRYRSESKDKERSDSNRTRDRENHSRSLDRERIDKSRKDAAGSRRERIRNQRDSSKSRESGSMEGKRRDSEGSKSRERGSVNDKRRDSERIKSREKGSMKDKRRGERSKSRDRGSMKTKRRDSERSKSRDRNSHKKRAKERRRNRSSSIEDSREPDRGENQRNNERSRGRSSHKKREKKDRSKSMEQEPRISEKDRKKEERKDFNKERKGSDHSDQTTSVEEKNKNKDYTKEEKSHSKRKESQILSEDSQVGIKRKEKKKSLTALSEEREIGEVGSEESTDDEKPKKIKSKIHSSKKTKSMYDDKMKSHMPGKGNKKKEYADEEIKERRKRKHISSQSGEDDENSYAQNCDVADLEELQKMKEALTKELSSEGDPGKHHKSKKKRRHRDDSESSAKFPDSNSSYGNNDDIPLVTDSTSSIKHKSKPSNTYWNKYADKLGLICDDPREITSYDSVFQSSPDFNREDLDKKDHSEAKNKVPKTEAPSLKKVVLDPLSTRTGGAYIPPARLKLMQEQITDKSSESYQRLYWEALKKSINGIVNKVNISNIGILVRELCAENIVRGRGILCRSLIQAQSFSPTFTNVYAAIVSIINSKFPQIGELLLNRLIIHLRRGIKRNDKNICMASCKFLAHLINQQVAHEVIALEFLTLLLENAKDIMDDSDVGRKSRESSIELAIVFLKECGAMLAELTPKGLMIIMETLRNILHEGKLDVRCKYMIEIVMAVQKGNFKDFPSVIGELDVVEEENKITHILELDGKLTGEEILNVFKFDPNYEDNENKYKELKARILMDSDDENDSGSEGDTEDSGSEDECGSEDGTKDQEGQQILDHTETNLTAFRRTVYLTIQSSLDVDECAHKLLKGEIKPGWEEELCNMIIDCCAQQRTYMKFYGLLAARFCQINKIYQEPFEKIFDDAYRTCHRLEIEKLRNVAKLFSHLFCTDAISWEVMSSIRLNQDETTSSSRVFLKILFEELANFMGLGKLNERFREPTLSAAFEGLMPRDNPVDTRFAINFFTTIGLGGLTDDLREFLRSQPKPTAVVAPVQHTETKSSDSSSSSTSSESTSDSDSTSSSSDSDSDSSDSSSSSSDSDDSSSDSSDSNSDSDSSSDSERGVKSAKNKKKKSTKSRNSTEKPKKKSKSKKKQKYEQVDTADKHVSRNMKSPDKCSSRTSRRSLDDHIGSRSHEERYSRRSSEKYSYRTYDKHGSGGSPDRHNSRGSPKYSSRSFDKHSHRSSYMR